MTQQDNIQYSIVHFHIGRGGRFNDGGHKTFVGVENLSEVISNRQDTFLYDEDEDGNTLPDSEWKLTDEGGRVLLEGKDECNSSTGILDFDTIYDTEICKSLYDCDENELSLIFDAIMRYDSSAYYLTFDDVRLVAHSQAAIDKFFGATFTFNCDPETVETQEQIEDILVSIDMHGLTEQHVGRVEDEDWQIWLNRLNVESASTIWTNSEMLLCYQEDMD